MSDSPILKARWCAEAWIVRYELVGERKPSGRPVELDVQVLAVTVERAVATFRSWSSESRILSVTSVPYQFTLLDTDMVQEWQRSGEEAAKSQRFTVSFNPDSETEADVDPWEVHVIDGRGAPACLTSCRSRETAEHLAANPTPEMERLAATYEALR